MKSISGKELCKVLEKHGWFYYVFRVVIILRKIWRRRSTLGSGSQKPVSKDRFVQTSAKTGRFG